MCKDSGAMSTDPFINYYKRTNTNADHDENNTLCQYQIPVLNLIESDDNEDSDNLDSALRPASSPAPAAPPPVPVKKSAMNGTKKTNDLLDDQNEVRKSVKTAAISSDATLAPTHNKTNIYAADNCESIQSMTHHN